MEQEADLMQKIKLVGQSSSSAFHIWEINPEHSKVSIAGPRRCGPVTTGANLNVTNEPPALDSV